ncbi:hypothetical protein PG988_011475 [Apiospora saccharicola]
MSAETVPAQQAEALPLPESPKQADNTDIALIVIHDAADIVIVVDGSKGSHQYKVSSMNLATASDVLRAIIFGKDGKSVADANVTVDIGDVDPKAMRTLLDIAHFNFSKVPLELGLDDLCAVTALTSMFKCTNLIMPWATNWVQPLSVLHKNDSAHDVNYKAANIAWELGNEKLLRQMIKDVIMTAKVDSDGDLEHVTGTKLKDLVLPAGILDEIITIRTETIDKILSAIQAVFDNAGQTGGKYCKTGSEVEKCETMMIGSAFSSLLSVGLMPIPKDGYKESINSLVDKLEGITLQHWEGRNYAPHSSHACCNLKFKENAHLAIKEMADPLKEEHLEHLAKQTAASGVDSVDEDDDAPARRTRVTDTISGTGELLSSSRSASPKSVCS